MNNEAPRRPEDIIGRDGVLELLAEGYRILPAQPTPEMCKAAAQAMVVRKREMGDRWFYVSNVRKAAIRYRAMLGRWHADHQVSTPWKRWAIGKWFVLEIDVEHTNEH